MQNLTFDDNAWDNLLSFVDDGTVIPIVGKELSEVTDPDTGELVLFEDWLARQLANKVNPPGYEAGWSLNRVVCSALRAGQKPKQLLATIKRLIGDGSFTVPEALSLLAEITDFRLYVTTALDSLLEQALRESCPTKQASVLAYGPKRHTDLPTVFEEFAGLAVYHLFGRPDHSSDAAICEGDLVEWLAALQSPNNAPQNLCAALETSHVLLIGLGYDGWLARFFLRAAKRRPLADNRDHQEYLADPAALADGELVLFIHTSSPSTVLVEGVRSPLDFVRDLHRRWKIQSAKKVVSGKHLSPVSAPVRFLPPEKEMPKNAIFISYSRTTDFEVAKKLKVALDDAGLTSWFDLDRLEGGDAYEAKIRQNIKHCSYFIPIISNEALAREEAFFYGEWKWAISRMEWMGENPLFIFPLLVGSVDHGHHKIPGEFRARNFFESPDGAVPPALPDRLSKLLAA